MITTESLKTQSWKDLAEMAKSKGLAGVSAMRKDDLVKALMRAAKVKARPKAASKSKSKKLAPVKIGPAKSASKASSTVRNGQPAAKNGHSKNGHATGKNGHANGNGAVPPPVVKVTAKQAKATERIQKVHAERERLKDLSSTVAFKKSGSKKPASDRDRLVLMVRDSYWLQACWNVNRASVKRAEAAMAEHWHTARPVLRLLEVDSGHTTSASERIVREIEVHGGVTNWYIDVTSPPQSYRVELGYCSAAGKFFSLCRSNAVTTPAPDSSDAIDENWTDVAENYERVYALSGGYTEDNNSGELQELFEERLRRPMHNPLSSQFGGGAERVLNRHRELQFNVDAEMILYGRTKQDARVTLAGEPVKLRPDGTFTIRLAMPDKRQVLPVVASSADGVEQRTIVIAVERNTKVLEPMMREANE
ncbi:MAG: DUF4912 domain-containing protein [Pirellulaceae bacterium]|nr:DUF4912 domain-containing protein [Pirellulaceae bacterium]